MTVEVSGTQESSGPDWRKLMPEKALYGKPLKKKVIGSFSKLYPMPHVILKANQILSDPEADLRQFGNLLKADMAVVGRILKVANSAFFGLAKQVSSVQHAAVVLGTKRLLEIISMIGHSKMLNRRMEGYGVQSGAMWRHTLTVAVGADIIAKKYAPEYKGEAFLAGLLHDAGKIILDPYIKERRAAFVSLAKAGNEPIEEIEKKVLGFDHAAVGGWLCLHWNLPDFVADAIANHHMPSATQSNPLADILHEADTIANHVNAVSFEIDLDRILEKDLQFLDREEQALNDAVLQILEAAESLEDGTY